MTTIPPTVAPNLPAVVAAAAGPVVVIAQPPVQLLQLAAGATIDTIVVETLPPPRDTKPRDATPTEAEVRQPAPRTTDSPQVDQRPVEPRQPAPAQAKTASPQTDAPQADTRPTVILRTAAGDIAIKTSVPLDDGARVALEVLRKAPDQVTARLVAINDVPVRQALAQTARDSAQATPEVDVPEHAQVAPARAPTLAVGQAWTPSGPAPLPAIQNLSAYVLKDIPLPAGAPANEQITFAPGTDLAIRVVSVQVGPSAVGAAAPAQINPLTLPPTPAVLQQPNTAAAIVQPQIPGQPGAAPGTPLITPLITSPGVGSPQLASVPTLSTPPPGAPQPTKFGQIPLAVGTVFTSTPGQAITSPLAIQTQAQAQNGVALSTPLSIQVTESGGLKLPPQAGLGPLTPNPPQIVDAPPIVTRFIGQVISTTSTGAAVIQMPAGEMQLNVRANLPVGTSVTIEVLAAQPPRPDGFIPLPPTPSPPGLPLTTPTTGWPSITEALNVLQRSDPQAAAQLTAALPDGGPRTAVATMAFAQAMRSGDARQWPGDSALRGLERAGPRGAQLAAQISGEVREMAARAPEAQADWRTTPMPWNLEGKIERVNLISRREDAGEEEGEAKKKSGKGKGTRFLVNLELSRLGEMQLDGMFVKSSRGFDMMIRTKDPLPENMRQDLAGIFANSNAAMGLKGGLTFQVVKKFADPTNTKAAPKDRGGMWA